MVTVTGRDQHTRWGLQEPLGCWQQVALWPTATPATLQSFSGEASGANQMTGQAVPTSLTVRALCTLRPSLAPVVGQGVINSVLACSAEALPGRLPGRCRATWLLRGLLAALPASRDGPERCTPPALQLRADPSALQCCRQLPSLPRP